MRIPKKYKEKLKKSQEKKMKKKDEEIKEPNSSEAPIYRGGVRIDGTDEKNCQKDTRNR